MNDAPTNPFIGEMHQAWRRDRENLWPKAPLIVRAFELRMGEGCLTVMNESLLFETFGGDATGFDFPNLRQVRLIRRGVVDVAYSVQGELKKASFGVVPTSALSGREFEPDMRVGSSLLVLITGGIIARFISDHTNAPTEGIRRWTDKNLDKGLKKMQELIERIPPFERVNWEDVHKSEWEQQNGYDWSRSEHMKMVRINDTFDNRLLPVLGTVNVYGCLSPQQRIRVVAMQAKRFLRMYERGYCRPRPLGCGHFVRHFRAGEPTDTPECFKRIADSLIADEALIGNDLTQYLHPGSRPLTGLPYLR